MNKIKFHKKFIIHFKKITLFLWFWFITTICSINISQSYYFWLKSADNTPENIENIESSLGVKLPVVSFIFDPRDDNDVLNSIDKIVEKLWTDRIYHFTISPDMYSAKDVAMWKFDTQYKAFFKKIKEKNLHVIFRTMHEMNGWRYPWSSNPENFKAAWIHIWSLSRVVGLNEESILFDFSVNHRDMPTEWAPSQKAPLIQCNQSSTGCYHFEDYYPWNEFVDVVWFTFYNRWKANSNRQWLTPIQILYDPNWNTYERIKALNKPIIIDEVATTSVWYEWSYNFEKSRNEYLNHDGRKDKRIHQLWEFLVNCPEISVVIYFNTDYTHGLSFKITWEADWAIVNMEDNKVYGWFQELEMFSEKKLDNILSSLFHLNKFNIEWENIFISSKCNKEFSIISSIINQKASTKDWKLAVINEIKATNIKSDCITQTLDTLSKIYSEK